MTEREAADGDGDDEPADPTPEAVEQAQAPTAPDGTGAAGERDDQSTAPTLRERLASFPWAGGVVAGAAAFAAGYAVMGVYLLVGVAELPPPLSDQLARLGFILYNAHFVPIVGEASAGVAPSYNLLAMAAQPLVYLVVPVVVLLAAGGGFTYRRRPDTLRVLEPVMTALAITLGYLAVALVGTYVFTLTEASEGVEVLFHPSRSVTLLYFTVYPLITGVVSGAVAQVWCAWN